MAKEEHASQGNDPEQRVLNRKKKSEVLQKDLTQEIPPVKSRARGGRCGTGHLIATKMITFDLSIS